MHSNPERWVLERGNIIHACTILQGHSFQLWIVELAEPVIETMVCTLTLLISEFWMNKS